MKIVCESCGAKYSIADDRVAGKVFKIRCKRCSEVIVVRGDQDAGASVGAAAPVDDQNAIWHVVVDGEQAGPYSVSQLAELMNGGRVDWEAYVWAEGFDNWLPMRDVPDLVNQLSGQQQAAEPAYRASNTGTLTGQPSMGADPFADADQDGGGMFGGGSGGGGGHDLFAAAAEPASPFGGGGVVASSPSPRVQAESAMTGARNENSVLFSLKNLQALATGTPSMSPPTGSMGGGGGGGALGGGFAAGEGSGLIDIRALAAATGVSDARGASGPRDELLTIGSQGGAFGSLGSPILAPSGSDDDGNKKTLIWAGVVGVAMLSAAAVAIVFVLKPTAPQPVTIGTTAPAAPVAAPAPAPAPTPTPDPAAPAAPEEHAKADGPSGSSSGSSRRRRGDSSSGDSKPSASTSGGSFDPKPSAPSDAPKAPSKPSGPRSLDDLLNDAVSPGAAKPVASSAPKSDLAETPSRDQVKSAMGSVKDDVSACAKNGETGVATVSVSVAGESGRVTNAQVSGVTGPIGTCIAQAVRKAQFPKFSNKVFKVAFPFKL